jgi:sigma-B regulation protein RsbU (phosphoserine phosphatase)
VNSRLHDDLPAGRFVTAFIGFLSPDGTLAWCSGGHGPILARDGPGSSTKSLEATLPPLGVLPDMPHDPPPRLKLPAGGTLVVASDGITEAFNPSGEQFGEPRLVSTMAANAAKQPDEAIATLCAAVSQWQGKDDPQDDQTVVVVVRR